MTLVAITGYGTETDRARSEAGGLHRHLVKPVELAKLHHLLDRLLPDPR